MPSAFKIGKYIQLIKDLLPRGRLWKPKDQPGLSGLIAGMAPEFARDDDRVETALRETTDPMDADELIDRWEKMVGLPDECSPENSTLDERRLQVTQKYTSVGGLSKSYYEFLTAQLGYPSIVTKPWPFLVGRARVGDALTNGFDILFRVGMTVGNQLRQVGWTWYFNVKVPIAGAKVFMVGSSTVGEPLRLFENHLIECTIKRLKPAYSGVTFTYIE